MGTIGTLLLLTVTAPAWELASGDEVRSTSNLQATTIADGLLRGATQWDPYVFFNLPADGVDVTGLTRLTVRLWSSAPADALAVYYGTGDGRWALGSALPVVAGWAVYRVDLTQVRWSESSPQEGSRQWGGLTRRLTAFRLDPGNQAGRWVALDWVRLTAADATPFTPGVSPEAPLPNASVTAQPPATVTAGEPVRVSLSARAPGHQGAATGVLWLLGPGGELVADQVQRVTFQEGRASWTATVPTRRHDPPTTLRLRAGLLEAPGGWDRDLGAVTIANPLAGRAKPPTVALQRMGGEPAMVVNGEPLPAFFVSINGLRQQAQQAELGRAGVHLFYDWFGGSMASDLGHVAPDRYDYAVFDRYFAAALEADPAAWFLPHLGITPPAWWQQAHPEELCLYASGSRGPQSFASERWRRETGEDLRRLLAHLQAAPYADRIIGYCFFSGYSAEWQSWGLWQDQLADYSAPARRAWQAWLTRRYTTDEALRTAWRRPAASLTDPPLPTKEERHTGGWGALRDPATEQPVIDFYQFLSDLTADAIGHFAKVTKEASGGRALVGTYYGYLTQHSVRQQDSSHLALARVLACPDVDFLMSPPLYTGRQVGGTTGFMSATTSVQLHGKLWISEADYRTHLAAAGSGFGQAKTAAESQALLRREMGHVLANRAGVSWYDMAGGWLTGPDLVPELGRLQQAQAAALRDRRPFAPEVAVVFDESSATYVTAMSALNPALSLQTIAELPRVGVSWGCYLLDDVVSGRAPAHRVYLFLNAFHLTPAQRTALRERLRREGATAIWVYAAGLYGTGEPGVEAMRQLTGIGVERLAWGKPLNVTRAGAVAGGTNAPIDPVFVVADPAAEVLGTLTGGDRPVIARRKLEGHTSIVTGVPNLSPAFLRDLCRAAGCHIYLDSGDSLSVDDTWVCLHAATGGQKTLQLREAGRLVDTTTGETVGFGPGPVELLVPAGVTRLLRLER